MLWWVVVDKAWRVVGVVGKEGERGWGREREMGWKREGEGRGELREVGQDHRL